MKRIEDKRMVKLDVSSFLLLFKIAYSGHIFEESTHIHFLGAWSFFSTHIWFTRSEEPKNFVKKPDHENWTMKKKGHLPWCKPALSTAKASLLFLLRLERRPCERCSNTYKKAAEARASALHHDTSPVMPSLIADGHMLNSP